MNPKFGSTPTWRGLHLVSSLENEVGVEGYLIPPVIESDTAKKRNGGTEKSRAHHPARRVNIYIHDLGKSRHPYDYNAVIKYPHRLIFVGVATIEAFRADCMPLYRSPAGTGACRHSKVVSRVMGDIQPFRQMH